MKRRAKKRLKLLILSGLIFILIFGAAFFLITDFLAKDLVQPQRRVLQDYHRDFIDNPRQNGYRLTRFDTTSDKTPVLVAEPLQDGTTGKRGNILRSQLQARGHENTDDIIGTLVLLHGRNGRKEDLLPVAARFCAAGFRCLMPDLPASGESPIASLYFGVAASEENFAGNVLFSCAGELGFSTENAGLWGMSLGGSYAIHCASARPELWSAIVIVSSFDDLEQVIAEQARARFGPLGPTFQASVKNAAKTRYGFDTQAVKPFEAALSITTPSMVVHGEEDSLFHYSRGENLFNSISTKHRKWVLVPDGTHSNVLVTEYPLFVEMAAWFREHLPAPS